MASQNVTDSLSANSGSTTPIAGLSLDAGGLVALADLQIIQARTALTGSATLLDIFIICPGIHRQQHSAELNGAEFPAVAAMTSGYIFRVENPATVFYLQKIGKTGHLVTLDVSNDYSNQALWKRIFDAWWMSSASYISSVFYSFAIALTVFTIILLCLIRDWWAVTILLILMTARLCNIVIVRRRSQVGWKGEPEPGVVGDLLILVSQDRWVRLQGQVDDLKAVTSGQWLRDMSFPESLLSQAATMMVYVGAALASNAQQTGKFALIALLLLSAALLEFSNNQIKTFRMFGRSIKVIGKPKAYARRLLLAEELVKSTGRTDWAVRLGMIKPDSGSASFQEKQVVL